MNRAATPGELLQVYLDVNVAGPIGDKTLGRDFLANWNRSCSERGVFGKEAKAFELVATEGLLLELIGVQDIPKMEWTDTKADTRDAYVTESYEAAKKFFSTQAALTIEKLREGRDRQWKYLNPEGIGIYDRLVDPPLSRTGTATEIHEYLALEALCGRVHPEKFRQNVHLQIALSVIDFLRERRNTSFYRMLTQMWKEIRSTDEAKKMPSETVLRIDKSLGFKERGDFVDGELIHYSVIGTHNASGLQPVHCFTTDDAVKIKDRVFMFKALLHFLEEQIREIEQKTGVASRFTTFEVKSGFIHLMDKKGSVTETLNVSELASVE